MSSKVAAVKANADVNTGRSVVGQRPTVNRHVAARRPAMCPRTTLALIVVACFGLLTGCPAGKHVPTKRTDPASAIGEGQAKDKAITDEASGIVANPTDSAFVSAAAARILDVLRLSPWAKTEATIKALVSERDAASKRADDLASQLAAANQKTDQLIRLGLASAGAVCIGLGILSAFLAAKVAAIFPGLGPRISIGIGAIGAGFLFCSFAYGWALRHQTLVMSLFACACVAVAALFYANRHHASAPAAPHA